MNINKVIIGEISLGFGSDMCVMKFKSNDRKLLENLANNVSKSKDKTYDIDIKQHREKRSLNANAYAHVLIDKLADKLGLSKPRCKNLMLGRYGQVMYLDDDKTVPAIIKSNIPVSKMLEEESIHFFPCGMKKENGQELTFYKMIRGSSTYDTKEMQIFIDGIVSECEEQGIEVLTPDELARMVSAWQRA